MKFKQGQCLYVATINSNRVDRVTVLKDYDSEVHGDHGLYVNSSLYGHDIYVQASAAYFSYRAAESRNELEYQMRSLRLNDLMEHLMGPASDADKDGGKHNEKT